MGISNTTRKLYILWVSAAVIILLTLLFVNDSFAAPNEYEQLTDDQNQLVDRMIRKYLGDDEDILRFEGDAEIAQDDRIVGDVLIVNGTLDIQGEVVGDVLAVFGDVDLDEFAYVQGDVIAVNGKVWTEDESEIDGDIVISNVPVDDGDTHVRIEKREKHDYSKKHKRNDWPDADDESFYADYNRVDGLTLGLQFPRPGWWANRNHNYALLGKGAYSFGRKAWQYQLGLERWTGGNFRFGIGGEFHDMTDSQDDWIICDHENALAAAFIKEDFKDYYRRAGYSLYATQHFGREAKLKVGYHSDDFYNLGKVTNWSLFGKNKRFRANPYALSTGLPGIERENPSMHINSWQAVLRIDTKNNGGGPKRGWDITAFAEKTENSKASAMEFERYIVDVRRFQPLGFGENISVRLRAGTSVGILPPMYFFDLGGISTLRAMDYKAMTGDRMVLGNVEYRLSAHEVDFLGMDIILFVDSGTAWFANKDNLKYASAWPVTESDQLIANEIDPVEAFRELEWNTLKTNIGIALASSNDDFRINFARSTDYGGADIIVTFRICKNF